jgi:hypothetical protein
MAAKVDGNEAIAAGDGFLGIEMIIRDGAN